MELARALEPFGHTNRVVAVGPGHDGGTRPDIAPLTDGVRQHPAALMTAARRLGRDLAASPADVILAHGGSAMQVAAMGTWRARTPVVHQLIMGMPIDDRGALWRRWSAWVLSRAAATVSLTDALTTEVRALGYRGPVELIANARSTVRFADLDREGVGTALRRELGVGRSTVLLGFVGHLVAQKRPEVAVEVLAAVRAMGVDAHLAVTGEGQRAELVRQRIRYHDLDDHVTLLGHREEVETVLGALDVFLLTSEGEGMPGVVIEAQMAGTPVVSFPVGGVAEVVDHGRTGLVMADDDVDVMARAVAELAADSERLTAMGGAARCHSDRFSMERAAERYHRVLVEVSRSRS